MKTAHALLLAATAVLAACASSDRNTDTPTGPGQLVNLKIQPVRIPPNPQGALALGTVTGCRIDYVGTTPAASLSRNAISVGIGINEPAE